MEAGNILSADVLDIIFDTRNKEYGAYDLRKHYQRRLMKALLTTFLIVVLLLVAYLLMATIKPKSVDVLRVKDIDLASVQDKPKPEQQVVVPPPKQVELPKERMIKDMIPIIVKEDIITEVPEQDDVDDAIIGNKNIDGDDATGTIAPPVDVAKGVVDAPKKQDDTETVFYKVEIESQYPGGLSAWSAFLNRKLNYPQDAIDNEVEGTVMIQFIVDLQGNVSDVLALSGPEALRAPAIAVIKQSNKWSVAIQNGKTVKSYKRQPITFKLPAQ